MIYPTQKLRIEDFVVCDSVIKMHNLSIFKQMKQSMFSVEKVVECLEVSFGRKEG
jgi:hypothetical protein